MYSIFFSHSNIFHRFSEALQSFSTGELLRHLYIRISMGELASPFDGEVFMARDSAILQCICLYLYEVLTVVCILLYQRIMYSVGKGGFPFVLAKGASQHVAAAYYYCRVLFWLGDARSSPTDWSVFGLVSSITAGDATDARERGISYIEHGYIDQLRRRAGEACYDVQIFSLICARLWCYVRASGLSLYPAALHRCNERPSQAQNGIDGPGT